MDGVIGKAKAYLDARRGERVTLGELATAVGASPFHLQRRFKEAFGVSPRDYQDAHRVESVKSSLKKLKDMQAQKEAGMDQMSKKEGLMFERELTKLEKDIGGIQDMTALPDAMFVIDVGYHKIAVAEAKKLGIPVIGVVDTNHSPEDIDYVIPGNDDSAKAVALYARAVADAVLEGKAAAVTEVAQSVAGEDEFVEVNEGS